MKNFSIVFFWVIILFYSQNSFSQKVSIVYTVENTPVTSIEIQNEITYLKLINKKLNDVDDKTLVVYATKSILKEKIKEIEISKFFKFGYNDEIVSQNLKKLILSLGIDNIYEFENLLVSLGLGNKFIKKKIEIELLWNQLIFENYKNKISIDKNKIKEQLQTKIKNENYQIDEYKLSEILFSPTSKSSEQEEIKKIKKSIDEVGFKNTAIIYSLSNTSSAGGNIGWIKSTQLSKNIINKIENLNVGEISDAINVPAGKLILYLIDKRKVKEEISFEKELEKAIQAERNKQLNQFSTIYFKKIELNTTINEK